MPLGPGGGARYIILMEMLDPTAGRFPAALAALAAGAALAIAFTAQFAFGLLPCELCIWQRWPLAAAGALGLLALILGPRGLFRPLCLLAALAFLATAAIAGFHVGVEQKWWSGTASCAPPALGAGTTLDELRESILGQPVVRCDEPAWTLFGISMAGYNFLFSLSMGGLLIWLLRPAKHPGTAR
mgnify:CR=1 FL=1